MGAPPAVPRLTRPRATATTVSDGGGTRSCPRTADARLRPSSGIRKTRREESNEGLPRFLGVLFLCYRNVAWADLHELLRRSRGFPVPGTQLIATVVSGGR